MAYTHEEIICILSGSTEGRVVCVEHAKGGPLLSLRINGCLHGRVDDWQGKDAREGEANVLHFSHVGLRGGDEEVSGRCGRRREVVDAVCREAELR